MRYPSVFQPSKSFQHLDRALDQFFGSDMLADRPAVNILEQDDRFEVQLAAPGLQKADFQIEIKDGYLSISAEKSTENVEKNANFKRKEFSFASFNRRFYLSDTIDADNITATYDQGVLNVRLPKVPTQEKSTKKIEIA